MENVFLLATRKKLRFDINGKLDVESLWSVKYEDLSEYESRLQTEVDGFGKTNRRTAVAKNQHQEDTKLRLAIVSTILDVKDQESDEATAAKAAKAHNESILALIAEKQTDALKGKSIAELTAMLK